MRAAGEVLGIYQHVIEQVTLKPGPSGIFDVAVDGDVIFSKFEMNRHIEPGELLGLVREIVGLGVREYGT